MSKIRNILLWLFVTNVFVVNVNAFVSLSTEKTNYLQYEPVYIEIQYVENIVPAGFYISGLCDQAARIGLIIITPDGDTKLYNSPIQAFTMMRQTDRRNFDETLILNDGKIITASPGKYEFYLTDKQTKEKISNSIFVTVNSPKTPEEIKAIETITANPSQYGAFVYLEGGDQFSYGKNIVNYLAESNTDLQGIARTILAINSSQIKYDWVSNKIERDKDINKVLQYFPKNQSDGKFIPKYLQLRSSQMVISQFENIPISLKEEIKSISKKFSAEIEKRKELHKLYTIK